MGEDGPELQLLAGCCGSSGDEHVPRERAASEMSRNASDVGKVIAREKLSGLQDSGLISKRAVLKKFKTFKSDSSWRCLLQRWSSSHVCAVTASSEHRPEIGRSEAVEIRGEAGGRLLRQEHHGRMMGIGKSLASDGKQRNRELYLPHGTATCHGDAGRSQLRRRPRRRASGVRE